jgi:hypothetical protein
MARQLSLFVSPCGLRGVAEEVSCTNFNSEREEEGEREEEEEREEEGEREGGRGREGGRESVCE